MPHMGFTVAPYHDAARDIVLAALPPLLGATTGSHVHKSWWVSHCDTLVPRGVPNKHGEPHPRAPPLMACRYQAPSRARAATAHCVMGHFTTKHAWWPTRCSDDRLEPKNGFLVKFWVNNPCMRMHTNVFLWSKCALGSKKTTILGTFWFGLKSK